MKKILISGSIAYDYIMKFDGKFSEHILPNQLDHLNVGFTISNLQKTTGGTAHNIAYSLGLLGLKDDVIMLAAVGKDFMPDEKLSQYIDYRNILKDANLFTACAYILTDSDNNQMTSFYPGGMMKAVDQHIDGDIQYSVIAPNAKNAMLMQLKECKEKGIKSFFDPGQALGLFSKEELLQAIDSASYLISNGYEFDSILEKTGLGKDDFIQILDKIVITLGKDGVKLIDKDPGATTVASREIVVSGVVLENVIDPTGAGDSFRSGLLAGLSKGFSWEDSAKIGNVVASFVVASQGTLDHVFTKQDVLDKIKEVYGSEILF